MAGIAIVAIRMIVIARTPVTVAAFILRSTIVVAGITRSLGVFAGQRDRMLFGRQSCPLEGAGRVAVLATVPQVRLRRRLVAVSAAILELLIRRVTGLAIQIGVSPVQRDWMQLGR